MRRSVPRLRELNPLRWFPGNGFSYQQVPSFSSESLNGALQLTSPPWPQSVSAWRERTRRCGVGKLSTTKSIVLAVACIVVLALIGGGGYHQYQKHNKEGLAPYFWGNYNYLNGFFKGVRTLVPASEFQADNGYNQTEPLSLKPVEMPGDYQGPSMEPILFDPYPQDQSIKTCYLDAEETIALPGVYAYPGLPQHSVDPLYGSYEALGLEEHTCFERFGRYAAYGFGYNESHGGLGPGVNTEQRGSEVIFEKTGFVNYTNMDWGSAQRRCFQKNEARLLGDRATGKKPIQRQAYILRTWTGYEYGAHQIYALRAMITELSLKSGGEYDVHFLVHVKDTSIPIWADKGLYQETLEKNVPREFWNISTLWSEKQMEMYYPDPFPGNFAHMVASKLHGVYRSPHFALQWFAQQHPEYDQFWNWEMDLRYTGHYYDFNSKIGKWAKQQPRKGLWERNRKFYIPKYYGDWQNFTNFVEREIEEVDKAKNDEEVNGPVPIWGPCNKFQNAGMLEAPNGTTPPTTYEQDNYEWGVGEEADLLVFHPIFDPAPTNWVFRLDISGYDPDMPPPPRRVAIITVARLSKRLLDMMHKEVWSMKHTMFPEMWPPTVAMHHGLKAVSVPHPVYFDHDWDVSYANQIFNYPKEIWESPFGWGEHNMLGGSFYYNSEFSGKLWRRWLGQSDHGSGGRRAEEAGTGRMCLRGSIFHPIKHEKGSEA